MKIGTRRTSWNWLLSSEADPQKMSMFCLRAYDIDDIHKDEPKEFTVVLKITMGVTVNQNKAWKTLITITLVRVTTMVFKWKYGT